MASVILLAAFSGSAAGILRDGIGARSASLAGASVAAPSGSLESMTANPAGLASLISPQLDLNVGGAFLDATYSRAGFESRSLDDAGVIADAAFGLPLGSGRWAAGISIAPIAALSADWTYPDAAGGLGGATTYGLQRHHSEILVLRSALTVAWRLNDDWSVGLSGGHLYNRNSLEAPYTFQSEPILKGFKTLLDLEAEGHGWNAQLGVRGKISENVHVGLSYTSPSKISATGSATGNAAAQLTALGGGFAGVQPDFRYDTEVTTRFPQIVGVGLSWQVHPRWRLAVQGEWIDWSEAFDELRIDLTRGTNPDLNAFLGRDHATDVAPLDWADQWVARVGVEWMATDELSVRAGYAFAPGTVPSSTLTPLTGAIFEHLIAAGAGYRRGAWSADLSWQWNLPSRESMTGSALVGDEYDNAELKAEAHWIGLTLGYWF